MVVGSRGFVLFENCIVDASIFFITANFLLFTRALLESLFVLCVKGTRWMPWHDELMKDVGDCEMPRGVVNQALIRGCPNGETRPSLWAVTCR